MGLIFPTLRENPTPAIVNVLVCIPEQLKERHDILWAFFMSPFGHMLFLLSSFFRRFFFIITMNEKKEEKSEIPQK